MNKPSILFAFITAVFLSFGIHNAASAQSFDTSSLATAEQVEANQLAAEQAAQAQWIATHTPVIQTTPNHTNAKNYNLANKIAGVFASTPNLPQTSFGTLTAKQFGGLPATTLDSFVQNAGGAAFMIYGDEGTDGPPPLSDFLPIEAGINSGGLHVQF